MNNAEKQYNDNIINDARHYAKSTYGRVKIDDEPTLENAGMEGTWVSAWLLVPLPRLQVSTGAGVPEQLLANVLRRLGHEDNDPSALRAAKRLEVSGYERQFPHLRMTKEEAVAQFRELYAKYGARLDASAPESAWRALDRIKDVLTPDEARSCVERQRMMAEITIEFLAERVERVLEEMGQVREDMRVISALIQRLDGTVQGLVNEVRAEHVRFDRLDRTLEE